MPGRGRRRIAVAWTLAFLAAAGLTLGFWLGGVFDRDARPDVFIVTAADAPFVPVIESADLAPGETRIVVTLLDRDRPPTFADGTAFMLRFFDPVPGGIRFRGDAAAEAIAADGESYLIAAAPIDRAGEWALEVSAVHPDGTVETSARLPFVVREEPRTLRPGDVAPASPTDTLAETRLENLTTAGDPNPDLYRVSIRDLVETGQPFVVVFSTASHCIGPSLCDRALQQVARLAAAAGVTPVHTEPLELHGNALVPSASGVLTDWGLETDPLIFVVNADGVITARFELLASDAELTAALAEVAGG